MTEQRENMGTQLFLLLRKMRAGVFEQQKTQSDTVMRQWRNV